jgi:acyl dehydratase
LRSVSWPRRFAMCKPESLTLLPSAERKLMAGRYFDRWQLGDPIVHEIRRTVTETDNLLFSTMTHNPQPLHLDREVAQSS